MTELTIKELAELNKINRLIISDSLNLINEYTCEINNSRSKLIDLKCKRKDHKKIVREKVKQIKRNKKQIAELEREHKKLMKKVNKGD